VVGQKQSGNVFDVRCGVCFFVAIAFSATGQDPSIGSHDTPRTVLACAHRGEHLRHPENSLPAIQAAIDAGVDYVELDIRTSRDGYLVLMHDSTVNRMTDGTGAIRDMTLAEIKKLDLGARFPGKFPGLRIPTFDEALEVTKGKIGVYVDTKNAAPKDLIAAIERYDMGDHVMFYSASVEFLKQIAELRPSWKLMPEANHPAHVQELVTVLHPFVLAFDRHDFNAPTIRAAHDAHLGIFVDLLNPQDWESGIAAGVAGIQTDYPAELMAFLRARGYHK
jgi:glycerophosphoryl diester phosphodiesterase